MMRTIRIFVVDDQQLVRLGLVHMLGNIGGFTLVGEAESGEEALQKMSPLFQADRGPDVVLMDWRMPGLGGLETTRRLVHRYPGVRVIIVSSCHDNPFPQRSLENGAHGFVSKDVGIDELVRAIHAVVRGKRYLCQQVAQQLALGETAAAYGSPFEHLSGRELQTALMVLDGVKTADIATRLHLSPKSVNTYRYRLFDKLNIRSNMELALLAARHGLVAADEKN